MPLVMEQAALTAFLQAEFAQVAGEMAVGAVDETGVTLRLHPNERHLRPGGTISGPAMFALADVAMYLAILSRIGPVALAVTTNASIDFMRKPAAGRDLLASARILKLGRVLAVGDVMIHSDGQADPVARAGMTYSLPPR